ncbi:MAG: nucleotidyltransferase domain-containing protein [Saprospiraceae bacterium]
MDKKMIINKIKNNKNVLEKKFNIIKIGLFGSYSTDSSNEESDVDLIYELEEGKRLGFKDVYQLEIFIKDLLNIDKVDLVNHKYVNPIIEDEINKTVIYV